MISYEYKWIRLLIVLSLTGCHPGSREVLPPPYHSVTTLHEPTPFAKGKIKTLNGINFSKTGDVLYTSAQLDRQFDNGRHYAGIFISKYVNAEWSEPQLFPLGLEIDAYHPVLSFDNKVLFFNSRSHLDSANKSVPHDIWSMYNTKDGWSLPKPLDQINSVYYDSYPSVAKNGNLYFNSDRPGGKGGMDFYVSYYQKGSYQQPVNLVALNSTDTENDLVVDPLEKFIIFNRYIDSTRTIDLFISFRQNDTWSTPRKLDEINSDDDWELTPTLSPDGKYFFYELNSGIMQIDLSVILSSGEISDGNPSEP